MSDGNGNGRVPVDLLPMESRPRVVIPRPIYRPPDRRTRSLVIALTLFAVTIVSTLAAGVEFSSAYAQNRMPAFDDFFHVYFLALRNPHTLLSGLPFAVTLMGILLAHELGHFFACRYYRMSASFPYFIPAPTLFGTLGAFIRIRSAIVNRKALFDVGISGPVVGFVFAVPALALAILQSRIVPGMDSDVQFTFGVPLAMKLLMSLLRPGVAAGDLLLNPVGRAAWVGLFVTSLNLLPAGQLDGGHILYSLASGFHKRATLIVAIALIPLAFFWLGWILWAAVLLAIGFRHPPLLDRWEPLDAKRRVWAAVALAIFVLCFMPVPLILR
ncbi:MAG TPA: site-2 protease family protein [Candidatus Acidoferrales bacterium]|nr:site-2 protease family protein [Candidatus Acidoferrales bacterium]